MCNFFTNFKTVSHEFSIYACKHPSTAGINNAEETQ